MRYSDHEQRLMDQEAAEEQDRFIRREIKQIVQRHITRWAQVEEFHSRNTVWCCSEEAEACFNDLAALIEYLGLTRPLFELVAQGE